MGRRALVAVLAVPLACGARTALLLPGQGGSTGSAGGSGGGSTPLAVTCTAALQSGAPTPIDGYCPTRANQASVNGPRTGPQIAWSVTPFPIQNAEDFLPAEMVVDATGRAYIAIDASPQNSAGLPNQILAVNADGSVAWMSSFPSPVTALTLGADGNLWFLQEATQNGGPFDCDGSLCNSSLDAVTRDGAPATTLDLTPDGGSFLSYDEMAIGSDGTFFLGAEGSLARVSTDGALLWRTYANVTSALVLGPADDAVASGQVYDAAGNQAWTVPGADLAAVGAQGDVVGLSSGDGQSFSLVTVAPGGVVEQDVDLEANNIDAYQLAVAGDGTAVVLLANEASAPGLTKSHLEIVAVDASGKTRWTTPLDVSLPFDPANLTTHYGVFVDAAGTVIVTAGAVMGLDLASGSVLWTLQPAKPNVCLRPAVLGTGGAILATQCDGTVFLARDP